MDHPDQRRTALEPLRLLPEKGDAMNPQQPHRFARSLLCTVIAMISASAAFATNDTVEPGTPSGTIDGPSVCVTVPVGLVKGSPASQVHAFSVTFTLSSELELCDTATPGNSISAGDWATVAASPLFITDLSGGTYRVEQALLGSTCLDTDGSLFEIEVTATVSGTTSGSVTIDDAVLRDCSNLTLPVDIGGPATVDINIGAPSPIADLQANQLRTGNSTTPYGTTDIVLSFTDPGFDVEIWRAPFGNYPAFDGFSKPTLVTAVSEKINFQPTSSAIPSGYTPDYGSTYTSGFGWTTTMSGAMTSRDNSSTDPDYTFVRRQNDGSAAEWNFDIANGSYDVTVTCGDPNTTSTPYVLIEGSTLFDGNTTLTGSPSLFEGRVATVTVSDGQLTMEIGGSIPGRSDLFLTETKVTRIEISDGSGGSGTVPTAPTTYPPDPPWQNLGIMNSGDADRDSERDEYYYVAFVKNGSDVSDPSNMTDGTINYHLGDMFYSDPGVEEHPGTSSKPGDNDVGLADITYLAANYGLPVGGGDPEDMQILDIGPTKDGGFATRPLTDAMIEFEDLVVLSGNYGEVSKSRRIPEPAALDQLSVDPPTQVSQGDHFDVSLWADGAGDILAMSVSLSWDPAVVEPVGVAAGPFLAEQGGIALTPGPGVVDMAILGADGTGLSGSGAVASVSFRAIGNGAPRIAIDGIDARDLENHHIDVQRGGSTGVATAPTVTSLLRAAPNPFNPSTTISFVLAERGSAQMTIYSVDGRRVRAFSWQTLDPGVHEVPWNGADDRGMRVASGKYLVRLSAGSTVSVLAVTLLK